MYIICLECCILDLDGRGRRKCILQTYVSDRHHLFGERGTDGQRSVVTDSLHVFWVPFDEIYCVYYLIIISLRFKVSYVWFHSVLKKRLLLSRPPPAPVMQMGYVLQENRTKLIRPRTFPQWSIYM